ncbi:MAG TPA: response regulator [Kouleothrix sp.]|uniref:response regulator n=1 Tax=Kouleothrix sp. TaxID=2779161 RepID=UPI002C509726|nr:response regulator [Kouleothrix sp.]
MPNILVVDDHSTSQRLMSFILQQHQYATTTALNGRQALDRLAEQQFDLVITDLHMPELNGLELLHQMRSDERYRAIPVIILTGSVHDQDQMRAHEAGAIAFLTKPVGSDEVIATVGQLLAARRAEEPYAADPAPAVEQDDQRAGALKFLGLRLKKKINAI